MKDAVKLLRNMAAPLIPNAEEHTLQPSTLSKYCAAQLQSCEMTRLNLVAVDGFPNDTISHALLQLFYSWVGMQYIVVPVPPYFEPLSRSLKLNVSIKRALSRKSSRSKIYLAPTACLQ